MPIVSDTQEKKEEQSASKITNAIVAVISDSEKKLKARRKSNAKKFLLASLVGLMASLIIYIAIGPGPGIFAAIVSSTIPSAVNLVDD
jgi:hypothetical protein